MADTFDSFARRVEQFHDALEGPPAKALLMKIGMAAKGDAAEALRADIGDMSMSNWRRGKPFDLAARFDILSDSEVEVLPARKAAGPWRVLEEGRKPGGAYDLVQVGRRRKDGTRRGKSRGRNQGATAGKGTWSDALAIMDAKTPGRVNAEIENHLRRAFGG